mmetsp:Transcript_25130/g.77647  ORF Transcript_25130/g.77647 Transcript_25130/m.77647 type:complete len:267 (-) Transcript_25130:32-832(-)
MEAEVAAVRRRGGLRGRVPGGRAARRRRLHRRTVHPGRREQSGVLDATGAHVGGGDDVVLEVRGVEQALREFLVAVGGGHAVEPAAARLLLGPRWTRGGAIARGVRHRMGIGCGDVQPILLCVVPSGHVRARRGVRVALVLAAWIPAVPPEGHRLQRGDVIAPRPRRRRREGDALPNVLALEVPDGDRHERREDEAVERGVAAEDAEEDQRSHKAEEALLFVLSRLVGFAFGLHAAVLGLLLGDVGGVFARRTVAKRGLTLHRSDQ